MPRRTELMRPTWPLPWWSVALPAVAIAALTMVPYLFVGDWAYVAVGRLSSLAHESVYWSGTLAAVTAAWLGAQFANRRSPLAEPSVGRPGWRLRLRVAGTLLAWWLAAQLVAVAACLALWTSRATWRYVYGWDIAVATGGLAFFIITGLTIGVLAARWYAPLIALGWAVLWHLALPIGAAIYLPWADTNLETYLYPALAQQDHRTPDTSVMLAVAAWWVALLVLTLACLAFAGPGFTRAASVRRGALWGVFTVCASGVLWLPHVLATPFVDGPAQPVACRPLTTGLQLCTTQEQQAASGELARYVTPVVERMGGAWPQEITIIATGPARDALVAGGEDPSRIARTNVDSYGAHRAGQSLASSLAGTAACRSSGGSPIWAFAFTDWLAPSDQSLPAEDPVMATFLGKDDATILAWYTRHRDELQACGYQGPGPP